MLNLIQLFLQYVWLIEQKGDASSDKIIDFLLYMQLPNTNASFWNCFPKILYKEPGNGLVIDKKYFLRTQ